MSPRSLTTSTAMALAAASLVAALSVGQASAQGASGCGDLSTQLVERKTIAERLQAGGKKQLDAKIACAAFTQLVANGSKILKWADTNKEWCQVPDSFVTSIKDDHTKAVAIRAKACGIAAKQGEADKQAKEGGGGLLGGGGLTGSRQLPQGAL